jgi:hypothetical protein
VLLALDATLDCAGPEGRRQIRYRDFHTGYRQTALRPGELIVRVLLPPPPAGGRQGFRKVGTRAAQAISKVVVAAAGRVEDGRFAALRLAAGSVAPVPVRLAAAEAAAVGEPADAATAERVAAAAAAEVEPIDDVRSTAEYRAWVLGRVVRRLLLELAGCARRSPPSGSPSWRRRWPPPAADSPRASPASRRGASRCTPSTAARTCSATTPRRGSASWRAAPSTPGRPPPPASSRR